MTGLERLVRTGLSRIEIIKVKMAVNPLLWLTGLTWPICLAAIYLIDDRIVRPAPLGLGAVPILATLAAYFVFLFRDPDRLQYEEYRIRQRAMQMLYTRGQGADIVDIANQRPRVEKARARLDEDDQT